MRVLPHVVLTVVLTQLTSSPVDAQELSSFDYPRFYNGLSGNNGMNLSNESESASDRSSDNADFQLGENGVVMPSSAASPIRSGATSNRLPSHYNSKNAKPRLTIASDAKTTPKLTYAGSLSTNQEDISECDPSPMTPSDIETLVSQTAAR
jgi:hypothetical protein